MCGLLAAMAFALLSAEMASAQFQVNFQVDDALATTALGPERVGPMNDAVGRVKNFFENALDGSAAVLPVPLLWTPSDSPNAIADASGPIAFYSWSVVRNRLESIAETGNEPVGELLVYQSLPPQSVPFRWDAGDAVARQARPNPARADRAMRMVSSVWRRARGVGKGGGRAVLLLVRRPVTSQV